MIRYLLKLSGAGLLAIAASVATAQSTNYSASHHDYNVVTVADGLLQPWSMAWLPGGDMLITENSFSYLAIIYT